jgi:oxygen-independent coproporphyrinogen III oxidase
VIDAQQLSALLVRYEGHGPRYTSYPTALHFNEKFRIEDYQEQVALSNQLLVPRPLSLYVHVPFCASLCYYCGCNKVVTRNQNRAAEYVEILSREIALRAQSFADDRLIQQIHFGGGTPTFLSVAQIQEVLELIAQSFHLGLPHNLEMGIEIDPRSVSLEDMEKLIELGFNRFSFGIQDLNPEVQKAVNREQCFDKIKALVNCARELNIKSISFDLIYGLPLQTPDSFHRTLQEIIDVKPDRLALYNYAHMPDRMPSQRLIKSEDLPSSVDKLTILSDSIISLSKAGYEYIGMDHFALPDDSLAKAQRDGSLQRNFQGYSTNAEADLIGIGVSSISRINESYSQNATDLATYTKLLDKELLPIAKGLVMSRDDVVRADLIQRLMCGERIEYNAFGAEHDLVFDQYFEHELAQLKSIKQDGLLASDDTGFQVTELGRVFLRNIAMCFDHYLRSASRDNDKTLRYSKTI